MIFFQSSKSQKLDLCIRNLNAFHQIMKKLKKIHMNFLVWAFWESVFSKVAVAVVVESCDHKKASCARLQMRWAFELWSC